MRPAVRAVCNAYINVQPADRGRRDNILGCSGILVTCTNMLTNCQLVTNGLTAPTGELTNLTAVVCLLIGLYLDCGFVLSTHDESTNSLLNHCVFVSLFSCSVHGRLPHSL